MTYNLCKKIIENKTYISIEDMEKKLDVFYANNRLTSEEYEELRGLLFEEGEV